MPQEEYRGGESRRREGRRQTPQEGPRPQKRRKKRGRGIGAFTYLIFVIGVSALLAGIGWVCANDLLALNKEERSVVLTLPDEIFTEHESVDKNGNSVTTTTADMGYVAKDLKEKGLIEFKWLFRIFSALSHGDTKLTPGTYELNTDMDYRALITAMSRRSSNRMETKVTITEGMTCAQIFAALEEAGVSTVDKLSETAATYDFKFSFLKDVVPLGDSNRLEGYLFPDTYVFYMGQDPIQVLNKMLLRFDELFTDDLRQKAEDKGYTIRQILTVASMIEKETDGGDQKTISSVIYNRLEKPTNETAGYLNIDAAIAYVTGRVVTPEDYQGVDSPYNTYQNQGLPPGPIANPGMTAINAALNPDSTNYYFYVLGNDGKHQFSRTKAEHDRLVAQLRGS